MRNRSRGWLKCQLGENPLNRSAIHEKSRKACELTQGEDIVYSPTEISGNRGFRGMRKRSTNLLVRQNGTNALTLLPVAESPASSSTQKIRHHTSARPLTSPVSIVCSTKYSLTSLTSRKNSSEPLIIES